MQNTPGFKPLSTSSTRRTLIRTGLAATLAPLIGLAGRPSAAQSIDQVKFVYGFPAGSAGDVCVRRIAERVAGTPYTKNAPVVENKPGAGGRIAMDTVKAAAPDGSTLVFTPFACTAVYPHVYTKLSYDMTRDFTPVAMASVMVHGLAVGPQVPASVTDVKGFLAWAKANPEKANYGSPGAGSTPHFLGALLGLGAGVSLNHVAYRGSVPGVTDLVGGSLAAMVTPLGDFLPNHRAGRIRVLGHSGKARLPFANDLPTFAEQGFGDITAEEWYGFFAPARTPEAVISRANAAINLALKEKSVIDGLTASALFARGSTVGELERAQRAEYERWGPLVKRVGFAAES